VKSEEDLVISASDAESQGSEIDNDMTGRSDSRALRKNQSLRILGSDVHMVSVSEVVEAIEGWIEKWEGRPRRIVVTGFHGLWEAHRNPELKRIFNSADLWIPDGIAPIIAARMKGDKALKRAPGADVMRAFLERADEKGYSSFFFGDTEKTLAAMRHRIEKEYPGHKVAGNFSPPFRPVTPEEDEEHLRMINNAGPDVLWVGLGTPKQDIWIYEHMDRLSVPVMAGVGAAFGFLSGKVKRCPDAIGNIGLEWVYRLCKEPRKLWRRDVLDVPRFLFCMFSEQLGLRRFD